MVAQLRGEVLMMICILPGGMGGLLRGAGCCNFEVVLGVIFGSGGSTGLAGEHGLTDSVGRVCSLFMGPLAIESLVLLFDLISRLFLF